MYGKGEEVVGEVKEGFMGGVWNDRRCMGGERGDIRGIYEGLGCVGSEWKVGGDLGVKGYKV